MPGSRANCSAIRAMGSLASGILEHPAHSGRGHFAHGFFPRLFALLGAGGLERHAPLAEGMRQRGDERESDEDRERKPSAGAGQFLRGSARRAFIEGTDVLMTLRTNGELYLPRSGKTISNNTQRTPDKDIARVMFVGRDITKNMCKVLFNPSMNWDYFLYFYTALPVWAFQLPKRAFSLLYYIFAYMRINVKNINNENRVSYKTIQAWLNLPRMDETDTPKKEIIRPITDAINGIKNAHDEYRRQCMAELERQKQEQTTEEGRQQVERMIQKHIEMFDRPDFDIVMETPDATTKDVLTKGKVKIILNDPYKTKLQQIFRKGSGLLNNKKAVRDETE